MKALPACERLDDGARPARIVPIINLSSNAPLAPNNPYFGRWICNNEHSVRWWFTGRAARDKTTPGASD